MNITIRIHVDVLILAELQIEYLDHHVTLFVFLMPDYLFFHCISKQWDIEGLK